MTKTAIKDVDDILLKISKRLSTLVPCPLNYQEEKRKFFKSSTYNPVFTYPQPHQQYDHFTEILDQLEPEPSAIGNLLNEKIEEYKTTIKLLQSVGERHFTKYSLQLHGKPSTYLLQNADRLQFIIAEKDALHVSTPQLLLRMQCALERFGFPWQVEEREMVAHACVSHSQRKLLIRKNAHFPQRYVKRLIVHEIGTHILRSENAKEQPYKIFSVGFPGYLKTEEGLAVLNEELNQCLSNQTLKFYAGRVIAIDKALKLSFRNTYQYLLKSFDAEEAWNLTMRAKRGMSNTEWAGAYTKDYLYLQGYLEMKQYLKNGGDLSRLYYGRIGLMHIPSMKNIPGLVDPLYLPGSRYLSTVGEAASASMQIIRE